MRLKVLALIAVVVLAAGCVSNGEPENTDNQAPDEPPSPDFDTSDTNTDANESNTIYLTDDGFEPESLTIEQGETVTWIDDSSSSMWVGSDEHPTHTEYHGTSLREHCSNGDEEVFDQCETGDEFSFTFEKTGEWGYHNHDPYIEGGTITVQ